MYSVGWLVCTSLLWVNGNCASLSTVEQVTHDIYSEVRGTYWYLISHDTTPIGHLKVTHRKRATGGYEVARVLNFRVTQGREVEIHEVHQFDEPPPHLLQLASRVTEITEGGTTRTMADLIEVGVSNKETFRDISYFSTVPFSSALTEGKFNLETPFVDFDTKDLRIRRWDLGVPSTNSVRIATSTDKSVSHLLSPKGIPRATALGDTISITLTGQHNARSWQEAPPLLQAEFISVEVTPPLVRPRELVGLTLNINADPSSQELWKPMLNSHNQLDIDRNQLDPFEGALASSVVRSRHMEVSQPLTELIALANLDTTLTEKSIQAWMEFLHNHIRYEEVGIVSSIDDTLQRRTGDCTEFADVFDRLAEVFGWPSRTQVGLAYDEGSKTFRAHAWNEVVLDGQWVPIDVGWNQFPADASHVPFPTSDVVSVLAVVSRTRFTVVDQRYASQ